MNNSSRQFRKRELTKTNLKSAFIDLILENKEAEAITISEITNRADFNRGTFYIHYQDKIDLLEDLYEDAIEAIRFSATKPYEENTKVYLNDKIPAIALLFEQIASNKKLYKALDLIAYHPGLYDRIEQLLWKIHTKEVLPVQANDTFKTDHELLLSFQVSATVGVIKYWIKSDFSHTTDYMTEQLSSFYTNNIIAMNFNTHEEK